MHHQARRPRAAARARAPRTLSGPRGVGACSLLSPSSSLAPAVSLPPHASIDTTDSASKSTSSRLRRSLRRRGRANPAPPAPAPVPEAPHAVRVQLAAAAVAALPLGGQRRRLRAASRRLADQRRLLRLGQRQGLLLLVPIGKLGPNPRVKGAQLAPRQHLAARRAPLLHLAFCAGASLGHRRRIQPPVQALKVVARLAADGAPPELGRMVQAQVGVAHKRVEADRAPSVVKRVPALFLKLGLRP